MSWRPFWWDELDDDRSAGRASGFEVWSYRLFAAVGFGCVVFVSALSAALIVLAAIR